jgi:hypothetical protein
MAPPKVNNKRDGMMQSSPKGIIIGFVCLAVVVCVFVNVRRQPELEGSFLRATEDLLNTLQQQQQEQHSANAGLMTMKEWRQSSQKECTDFVSSLTSFKSEEAYNKKEEVDKSFIGKLALQSVPSTKLPPGKPQYQYCKNAFIDLGTNIGDSVGYFIDNAIDVCSPIWATKNPAKAKFDNKFPRPHIDVTTLQINHRGSKPNPLFGMLQKQAKDIPSESFCVYGMEGNPTFTERLTKLENYISEMKPKPVEHVHIFTESVITANEGPTKLYLDKTSVDQNVSTSKLLETKTNLKTFSPS